MSQQGVRLGVWNGALVFGLDYNGSMIQRAANLGIPPRDYNGTLLAYINLKLGTAYDNLPGAMAAFAAANGATNFSSVGTFTP